MHRTRITFEDNQYERLRLRSLTTGTSIDELVRHAVDELCSSVPTADRLQALDDSFGAADKDDFDGSTGQVYVEQSRSGRTRWLSRPAAAAGRRPGRRR